MADRPWKGSRMPLPTGQQAGPPAWYPPPMGQQAVSPAPPPMGQGPWYPPPTYSGLHPGSGWGGGGGGGGGGQGDPLSQGAVGTPAVPTVPDPRWTGQMPGQEWLPWTSWEQTPWAYVSEKMAPEAMQWFSTMLPWMQQQVQGQQWQESFDWRKAMDEWRQQFETGQDVWARGFQEQQLAQQRELEREGQAMQTFGRRWRPQTRWM